MSRLFLFHESWCASILACSLIAGWSVSGALAEEPEEQTETVTDVENVTEQAEQPPSSPQALADPQAETNTPDHPQGAFLGVELNPQFPGAAIVSKVVPGSAAEKAGLKAGDRIWGLNNRRINSINDLILTVSQLQPGEDVEVQFSRPQRRPRRVGSTRRSAHARAPSIPSPATQRASSGPRRNPLPAKGQLRPMPAMKQIQTAKHSQPRRNPEHAANDEQTNQASRRVLSNLTRIGRPRTTRPLPLRRRPRLAVAVRGPKARAPSS